MKVYAGMDPALALGDVGPFARRIESLGYDGLHVAETVHDAMMVALVALEHTSTLRVRTAVALAFVRSPTLLAYGAWDLSSMSGGRFELGLGTQIRQNIEDRYAMTWSEPIGRMGEYLDALEALFGAFSTGESVDVNGEHYCLKRLQPYFNPGPDETVVIPPVWLGGVNPKSCQLAGARAAGFITHPTNSNLRYLDTICLPNLELGAQLRASSLEPLQLVVGTQVICGATQEKLQSERERQRRLFAFLYSTPAYKATLELYGLEALAPKLRALIRENAWDALASLVTDEVLELVIPSGEPEALAELLIERFAARASGVLFSVPDDPAIDAPLRRAITMMQEAS